MHKPPTTFRSLRLASGLVLTSMLLFSGVVCPGEEASRPASLSSQTPARPVLATPVPGLKKSGLESGTLQPSTKAAGSATGLSPQDEWQKQFSAKPRG